MKTRKNKTKMYAGDIIDSISTNILEIPQPGGKYLISRLNFFVIFLLKQTDFVPINFENMKNLVK